MTGSVRTAMNAQNNAALPDGLEIAGYRIVKKIASGGFSIVYLAHDEEGNAVAIKEYLPGALAVRMSGELVPTIATEHLATYRIGLKCFFEEGRALASISHRNVVSVLNFFRANETVYMVMAYESGRTLQELILRRRARKSWPLIPEKFIRAIFSQVMHGLREVHAHQLLHLDLKPANIYLRLDGTPLLLDFGASRQSLKADVAKLYPMYTPGFAAPELYVRHAKLGPWTDIYGLGAAMFSCLSGTPPPAADERKRADGLDVQLRQFDGMYSAELLELIRWSLKLDPLERPQSVFALQKALRPTGQEYPPGGRLWQLQHKLRRHWRNLWRRTGLAK